MFRTRFLMFVLTAVAGCSASAAAGDAPDSARAAQLQARADSAWRVRITTRRATYVTVAPRLDAGGITIASSDHPPALISTISADDPKLAKRITWEQIERVDVERPSFARGFGKGFLIGAAVVGALSLYGWKGANGGEYQGLYVVLIPYSILTGGLIGGLLGGAGGASSQPIYP